jgi:hypothetical protein
MAGQSRQTVSNNGSGTGYAAAGYAVSGIKTASKVLSTDSTNKTSHSSGRTFDLALATFRGLPAATKTVAGDLGKGLVGAAESYPGAVASAARASFSQGTAGYSEAVNAKNPVQLLEGSTAFLAGGINTAFSPMAPVFSPVNNAVNYAGDKIGNLPQVQTFANTTAGNVTSRVATDVSNLSTIAGTIAGGAKVEGPNLSRVTEVSKPVTVLQKTEAVAPRRVPETVAAARAVMEPATQATRDSTAAVRATKGAETGNPVAPRAASVKLSEGTNWAREETLLDHFTRHGSAFGAKTPVEYASKASEFFQDSKTRELPTKIDNDVIRIWDPQTRTFGSYNSDGTTRTFFKSSSPTYFDRQPGIIVER